MSTFIQHEGVLMPLREYLKEAFELKTIDYGNNVPDFNNRYVSVNVAEQQAWTFAKLRDDIYILLALHKQSNGEWEFGFGSSKSPSTDFDDYTEERLNKNVALRMFNGILYVLVEMMKERDINVETIFFDPADPKLGYLYSKIVKNKSFIKILKDNGFESVTGNEFKFKKVG